MLLTFEEASSRYDCDKNKLYSLAYTHMRQGVPTPWLKGTDHKYIDTDLYERQSNIQKRCYDINTIYLYWLAIEILNGESNTAEYMAKHSHKYNSKGSWAVFLDTNMWEITTSINVKLNYTMQTDFTILASRLVYDHIKQGKQLGRDFR